MSYDANPVLIFYLICLVGERHGSSPKHCKHDNAKHVYILCRAYEKCKFTYVHSDKNIELNIKTRKHKHGVIFAIKTNSHPTKYTGRDKC